MSRRPSLLLALADGPARCELLLTSPFALVGGGALGGAVAGSLGLPAALCVPGGALGLLAFVAFQLASEPWVVERLGGKDGRWGAAVAYLWDVATGAVVGYPFTLLLDLPTVPGVGAAVTAGAAYGFVMGFVVCGGGAEWAVRTLLAGGGLPRRPDHSLAQSLEQRGELDRALAAYRDAREADPGDPLPYLGAARVLTRLGRPGEALEVLRAAMTRAHLDAPQEVLLLQRIAAHWEDSGRREAAAADLARYLERAPQGPAAPWARTELAAIKADVARRLGRPPPE